MRGMLWDGWSQKGIVMMILLVESNNPNPFWDLGISHTKCTRPEDFYAEVNLTFNVRKISVRAHLQT